MNIEVTENDFTAYQKSRKSTADIKKDIENFEHNYFINRYLELSGSIIAILTQERQVISLNLQFLKYLGISNPSSFLGLRLGEVLHCKHCNDSIDGCGSSMYCKSCNAAIAMLLSLKNFEETTRYCSMEITKNSSQNDLYFRIQVQPIILNSITYLIVILQDVTKLQNLYNLERIFFHDINNSISAMGLTLELMSKYKKMITKRNINLLYTQLIHIQQEINLQKYISFSSNSDYLPRVGEIYTIKLLKLLNHMIKNHPSAKDKYFQISNQGPKVFYSDETLVIKIVFNMLINAFEASIKNDHIILTVSTEKDFIQFSVWNRHSIPKNQQYRIFQKNFSTKKPFGRGLGTYSMKLFGEKILKGKMFFTSNKKNGTTFYFMQKIKI